MRRRSRPATRATWSCSRSGTSDGGMTPQLSFPGGARFAFTVIDDTDVATVENVRPIYRLLESLGMRTTKTVWPVRCEEGSRNFSLSETLDDAHYRDFVVDLHARGFEIAFHGATMETSPRDRTARALQRFQALFGAPPSVALLVGRLVRRPDRVRSQSDVLRDQPAAGQSVDAVPRSVAAVRALVVFGNRRRRRRRIQRSPAAREPGAARGRGRRLHRGYALRQRLLPGGQAASADPAAAGAAGEPARVVSARGRAARLAARAA